jgi:hypothetical protein
MELALNVSSVREHTLEPTKKKRRDRINIGSIKQKPTDKIIQHFLIVMKGFTSSPLSLSAYLRKRGFGVTKY